MILYDLATYLFPFVWFALVCQYYFLVTNESLIDVYLYFYPFYLAFASLFIWAPPSFALTWVLLCHFSLTTWLCFQLMKGDWWTFFKWFKLCAALSLYRLSICRPRHQLFHHDIQFRFPTSLTVTLFGPSILPHACHRQHFNPICHHQLSICLRIRYHTLTLRQWRRSHRCSCTHEHYYDVCFQQSEPQTSDQEHYYDAYEHNFQEEFYEAQQPEDFFDAQEPDRFYDANESLEFEPINLSSARAIMTLDLPQQVPPDQLAHSSKVQELQ